MDMGYSKNVAEKAVFMVSQSGIDQAMQWIEENDQDSDFEEPLMIVVLNKDKAQNKKASKFDGKSKEEKAAKLKQM